LPGGVRIRKGFSVDNETAQEIRRLARDISHSAELLNVDGQLFRALASLETSANNLRRVVSTARDELEAEVSPELQAFADALENKYGRVIGAVIIGGSDER
jgi:ABC-type transporter Mla subunit MlaD